MTARVAVSLDVSAVPAQPAGAGRYTLDLAGALVVRNDTEVTFVARRDDADRWRRLAGGDAHGRRLAGGDAHGRRLAGDTHSVVPAAPAVRPARLLWEQLVLPRLLRSLPVALHHGPHYTMPERSPVPTLVTIHDLTFFDHPEWHERTKVPVFRRAIRVAARHAGALVCVSRSTAERLSVVAPPAVPVHVIPHGVDHARFRPEQGPGLDDRAVVAALGVRAPYVAFVGTLEPRKDVPTLVRAFDRIAPAHPDLRLVLAGGAGWGADAVSRAIAAARHRAAVVRTGYVPDEAVPALLRQAAAVAYPSLEEGFGLPALEALACGAPLVTTTGSAMEEVAAGAALLVPPGDVDALAGALDMLVRGDASLAARRGRGFEVAARHTWEASARLHVEAYRSLL